MASRDARFDGVFFTAVHSTGIYCRPSCPARTPKPAHMDFYPSAAAARGAGFRACRRCAPDAVPGSPEWNIRADVLGRVVRLIADGVVDREGVTGLAARVGYSARQLERITSVELGASPLALARAQRVNAARILIETTDLPFAEIAFAAGFGSIRSFNDAVREAYALTPSALRGRGRLPRSTPHPSLTRIALRLSHRTPLSAEPLFGHLAATAVPGVEEWRDGAYRRTLRLPHGPGIVALRPQPNHVAATCWLTDPADLAPAIARCRRLLDLDADPTAVDAHLSTDPALAPLVACAPGARIPGTVDAAELAIRIVLGQQISTARARTLTALLARPLGEPIEDPDGGLTHLFPTPDALASLDPAQFPGPRRRGLALCTLASALAAGDIELGVGADWQAARNALAGLAGIGPWTIEMIAMRGLGDPDAWPASDLGIRRAWEELGRPDSSAWRPWRSYAAQYLWSTLDHPINRIPQETS